MRVRNIGDRIQFQVMPHLWPEKRKSYEGVIIAIIDPDGDMYYHVDAQIGSEHVEDGIVYEHEIVSNGE